MRRALRLALLASVALLATARCLAAEPAPRPEWCRPGYVCLPTADVGAATEEVWRLRSDLAATKAKAKRFGLTVGFGAGVGGVVQDDFSVNAVPVPGGLFIVWGLRL